MILFFVFESVSFHFMLCLSPLESQWSHVCFFFLFFFLRFPLSDCACTTHLCSTFFIFGTVLSFVCPFPFVFFFVCLSSFGFLFYLLDIFFPFFCIMSLFPPSLGGGSEFFCPYASYTSLYTPYPYTCTHSSRVYIVVYCWEYFDLKVK